ncbi:hypothetical protein PILCRDRAFT_749549 [Piloderma croceum F 1598]|uniref:Uncharacterized protein n=1 Tax=Piloderma croceum (strain F 1598) TaxID=765440 RepID=A0A0C3EGH9_PILCF|nr:hypothetical protein PILCRDRAFT_749549 [Piloderma croceum F 1598]
MGHTSSSIPPERFPPAQSVYVEPGEGPHLDSISSVSQLLTSNTRPQVSFLERAEINLLVFHGCYPDVGPGHSGVATTDQSTHHLANLNAGLESSRLSP